jgi:hypothetical protein
VAITASITPTASFPLTSAATITFALTATAMATAAFTVTALRKRRAPGMMRPQ